jgi:hypothetical protein
VLPQSQAGVYQAGKDMMEGHPSKVITNEMIGTKEPVANDPSKKKTFKQPLVVFTEMVQPTEEKQ